MNSDDINVYVPSLLNPRAIRKQEISLTQKSHVSRLSLLSLKRNGVNNPDHDNEKSYGVQQHLLSENRSTSHNTAEFSNENGDIDCSSLLLQKTSRVISEPTYKENAKNNKNKLNVSNIIQETEKPTEFVNDNNPNVPDADNCDIFSPEEDFNEIIAPSLYECDKPQNDTVAIKKIASIKSGIIDTIEHNNKSVEPTRRISSTTNLNLVDVYSESTIQNTNKPPINISFAVKDCENVDVDATNCVINRFSISHNGKSTNIDCEIQENSQTNTETDLDENMNETIKTNQLKRSGMAVSLEIKKRRLTNCDSVENSKVLILNTNAIEKITHVIVQPPNYNFLKQKSSHNIEYRNVKSNVKNGYVNDRLKQASIESFINRSTDATIKVTKQLDSVTNDGAEEMSKNSGVIDAVKCDRGRAFKSNKRDSNDSSKSARLTSKREFPSPRRQDIKASNSDAPSPRVRNESNSSYSPRKNVESTHFSLPVKSKSNRTSLSARNIPHHKIVAGTHFAVDAFSYGEIPNVKHYFLTHFHSDHYSGLKKSFNKLLFCSKITADLCISRLCVNPKYIHILNVDEALKIDGIEVTALDANHCPGAIMLAFTLPNGKTLLHTGDFRACPSMESYPLFWNKDIHTVYLDTTYCNPRYDFPTQDQSLEMALYILRQKKMALEKVGRKFTSVLIVCGTYTIGKEKFFMGMSRRVGCAVWACPEKERVLRVVEGRATPAAAPAPRACQLHVVPMRDLTHEKLRIYLDSLDGAFSEVVAFKPSGWENGKNSSVEKDGVTIHGIPYSEHSSFSELIRFVKFLKPKQVVPTVDISGGVKSVQKYFPCPLVFKDEIHCQTRVTEYFSIHSRQQVTAVT